jgi:chaperonin GroEL
MKTNDIKIIKQTFQEIADIVTPTMGAKGRLAVIQQEMDRPLLTDDGVTVARQTYHLEGLKRLPATSMIEAASNTEKEAYDGTTLTVLLTNEFYKLGLKWMKPKALGGKGMHPQVAADYLERLVTELRTELVTEKLKLTPNLVPALSNIVTKIPFIGDIVYQAYKAAGEQMNITIEHDMTLDKTEVEHTKGLVLNSGYMSEVMRTFCNEKDKTIFEDAKLVLLSEDLMTQTMLMKFFQSLPETVPPLVFIVTPNFNPESLKILLDALVPNQTKGLKFQFIFLNEEYPDELYLDIAAFSNGKIQDAALGTSNYLYEHCGTARRIEISIDKTTIEADGDATERIELYENNLKEKKFELSVNKEATIRRRLSNLKTGLVKLKLNSPTVTEYMTLRLKLDDAIGAVRKAFEKGVLPGMGMALFRLAHQNKTLKDLRQALEAPLKTILGNAGLPIRKSIKRIKTRALEAVIDVKTNEIGTPKELGIIDGLSSVDTAVKNASSIAVNYLRAYVVIGR